MQLRERMANPEADGEDSSTGDRYAEKCLRCGEGWGERGQDNPSPRYVMCYDCERERQKQREAEEAEKREKERRRTAARRSEVVHSCLADCGANPFEHGNATIDNYDAGDAGDEPVRAVRDFVEEVKTLGRWDGMRGLYLFGDTGTGKSHLAVAALREIILHGDHDLSDVVFDHALALIGEIQDTYSEGTSAAKVIRKRVDAAVWILDDFGTENPSADVVRRLTEIFTRRAMRPTLVTSNIPPHALEDRHPELYRVQSRLGPAYFRAIEVKGRDRRFDAAA
jgi:DNA replication protein DnaC